MSEYTSTIEGFQKAMKWSLTGSPEEAKQYVEATTTPTFYHIFNNHRIEGEAYLNGIIEWRAKSTVYEPIVHEFLRDGEQLAARMTGTMKVDGISTEFESFMFAKIDKATGKIESLIERAVWGAAGAEPEHGVKRVE